MPPPAGPAAAFRPTAMGDYFEFLQTYFPAFLSGMGMTVLVCIFAATFSFLLGLTTAVLRVTPSGGLKWLAIAYTEFFRNTPLLVQTLAFYFGLPRIGIRLNFTVFGWEFNDSFGAGVLALSLYTGAFVAEAIRAGLIAVPRGQGEAARSLGLSIIQTLTLVIIPQAIRLVLPPLGNIYSAMLKNSAILSAIGLAELMNRGDWVNAQSFQTYKVFTSVIIFYLMLTLPMGAFVHWLERKYNPLRARTLRLRGARV